MSKIKNVIFDIGNVLVDFNWDRYIHSLFTDETLIQELNTAIWGDGRWDRLDWGENPKIAIQRMIDYAPEHESEIKLLFSRVGETLGRREYSHDWINSLKSRGYRVYYLSNYSKLVMNANPDVLDFLPLMDGGVFSCNIHMIKPEHEIYRYIAKQYNLVPSECVFIDDLLPNVRGAEDCGFHAIQFLSYQQAHLDLEELLKA